LSLALLTDPVLESWRGNVDDILAIVMARKHVEIIATTEGNADARTTYMTAMLLKIS